ncbi:hypothetical protein GF327_01360 [Candidatus Woesearchaeota archaeon]|nr:hypothetical protein [Candidatus Woesearchaeota archaeon]
MNFEKTLRENQDRINNALKNFLDNLIKNSDKDLHTQNLRLLKHYILSGGKRLRLMALYKVYESYAEEKQKIIIPGLCIELLHTSTLVFDDIMDEDDYRRNSMGIQYKLKKEYLKKNNEKKYQGNIFSSASKRYAASRSMLIGLYCEMLSRKVLHESEFSEQKINKALSMLDISIKECILGQTMDIEMEGSDDCEEEDYLEMIYLKTGSLFTRGMQIGAILGGAEPEQIDLIFEYGKNISSAFQIQDDIMDISPDLKKGNTFASDIIKGKTTILAIKAWEFSDKNEKIKNLLGKPDISKKEIREVVRIFKESGSVGYAQDLAEQKIRTANDVIEKIDMNHKTKQFFRKFSEYMLKRKI